MWSPDSNFLDLVEDVMQKTQHSTLVISSQDKLHNQTNINFTHMHIGGLKEKSAFNLLSYKLSKFKRQAT